MFRGRVLSSSDVFSVCTMFAFPWKHGKSAYKIIKRHYNQHNQTQNLLQTSIQMCIESSYARLPRTPCLHSIRGLPAVTTGLGYNVPCGLGRYSPAMDGLPDTQCWCQVLGHVLGCQLGRFPAARKAIALTLKRSAAACGQRQRFLRLPRKAPFCRWPGYLQDHLHRPQPSRTLRSDRVALLRVPPANEMRLMVIRKQAFSVVAHCLWNTLFLEARLLTSP